MPKGEGREKTNYKHLVVVLIVATMFGVLLPIIPVAAEPVVDGIISAGEYDGAMMVQLVGPYPAGAPFPSQTVDCYIYWDTQYLWIAVDEPVPGYPTGGTSDWIEFCFDAGPSRSVLDAWVLFANGVLQYVQCPKPSGSWGWAPDPFPCSAATNTATEFQFDYTDYGITFGDTIKMVIDRGKDAGSYPPLGDCVIWPENPTFYPSVTTSDLATWGDVPLNGAPPSGHVVDGVISAGEYDGGTAVQLTGLWDPLWTVDAYIDWDDQFLYVAVDEPVPADSGTTSWIEFAFDAGPARSYLDAFVLFGDGSQHYVQCPKPPGSWGWETYSFLAATSAATEFRVDYTDFGIAVGDTIKMSIDRNDGPAPPDPYGFAAFWPASALVYQPHGIDPTTWGDVTLSPPGPPPGHVVDGVISAGEYDGGTAVQLVGRTDPLWTVDAYIDWDTEFLYVAVDEPVPPGGGLDWIEFAFDPGPARPFYDGFALFGDGHSHHVQCPKPPGSWSVVAWPHPWWAATDTATEFKINYLDFGIAVGDTIKMSIDRNDGPAPPDPYGFAAFWPELSEVYDPVPDPTTWGDVTLSVHHTLTVNIAGSGSVIKSPDQETYAHGTVVQLTAIADPGWTFSSTWSGDLTGSANPDYITMDEDKTVTATFTQDTVSLTVVSAYDSPNPSGTTSYTPGTSVTASVTSPVAGPTGYRYVCTGWTGTGDVPSSGTGTTVTFTINQDSDITWTWKTQTYLTVKTDPLGIATIPGEGWYDKSTNVTLTAPDVPGYVFTYWDYNGISQGDGVNPITVQVDCTATAHYTACPPVECEVTFLTDPVCNCYYISFEGDDYHNGTSGTFLYGTSGSATAHCGCGWVFDHWEVTGDVAVSDPNANPTNVTINCGGTLKAVCRCEPVECEVTFLTDPVCNSYYISFEGDDYHNGTSGTFLYGTSGSATAHCAEGWVFDHWEVTGDVAVSSTTENPTTVTITCGGTLKAVCRCEPVECEVTFLTDPVCNSYYISFEGDDYHNGTSGTFPYGTFGLATAHSPECWVLDHWEVTGNVAVSNTTANPTNVTITCGGTLKAVFVDPVKPTALFTRTPQELYIGQDVTFDASSSYDPDGYIVSYMWDFGDGNTTTVTDPIVVHNYLADGTYDVTLTVTDNDGLTDIARNSLPVITLLADLNSDGVVDIFDVVTVSSAFGSEPGDPDWNEAADITDGFGAVIGDGIVDIFDVIAVAREFGKPQQ